MVEGGSHLHSLLIKKNLVDRIILYQGPTLLGQSAVPWIRDEVAGTIRDAKYWKLLSVKQIEDDIKMEYLPRR